MRAYEAYVKICSDAAGKAFEQVFGPWLTQGDKQQASNGKDG
jgi:hypothetical protein